MTQFVDDPQLYGIIGAVDDIANGGFGNATFHVELVLDHVALIQQLRKTLTDSLIQFHVPQASHQHTRSNPRVGNP